MDDQRYVFRIDAYTPESIPMARLASYLLELAALMGNEAHVHFDRLKPGSTKVLCRVEEEDAPKVESRLQLVHSADVPADVERPFRRLNVLLGEDGASGTLRRIGGGHAGVLKFPGSKAAPVTSLGPVKEFAELEGELVRVGGKDESAHMLLIGDGGREYRLTTRSRDTAKAMAAHLYEVLRVRGMGVWLRDDAGWQLQQLTIEDFEPVEARSFVFDRNGHLFIVRLIIDGQ